MYSLIVAFNTYSPRRAPWRSFPPWSYSSLMGALVMCLVGAASPVSGSFEVLVRTPVSVRQGHTITLPCWLNPPQSADGLEVSWYRGSYGAPVMSYRDKKFENASQDASYAGRVGFGLKDAASAGLSQGDVSLKLEKATVRDAGDYICYVSSEHAYNRATVSLTMTEVGTSPLLSAVWEEDNMLNMSCESEGWYPKPNLRWSDEKQLLQPTSSLRYSEDSSGLQSVCSWILVSSSSEVSCSVGISGKEPKEARVRLKSPPLIEPKSSPAGWVCFALLLAATVVLVGFFYWKQRRKEATPGSEHADETDQLLKKDSKVIPSQHLSEEIKGKYVNVTLQRGNPHLKIRGSRVRDGDGPFPDGDAVTCITAVTGTSGFSSGQHYWEVSLSQNVPNVPLKESWWVGVTSRAVLPQVCDFLPTTSNGLWFLSSSPDGLQFNTEPRVLLPVSSRPETVGVFLDHDQGELSFYNVEDGRLISSLTTTFKGVIFPLFNPGKGDIAVMDILQREELRKEPDMQTTVEMEPMNTAVVQEEV